MVTRVTPIPKTPIGENQPWRDWTYHVSQVLGAEGSAPTVSGSKGSNAALTSLITALAAAGIIKDSTS